jgi:hypothetical protein
MRALYPTLAVSLLWLFCSLGLLSCQREKDNPGASGRLTLVNPVSDAAYHAWETFDPTQRSYDPDPQAKNANLYFNRRVKGAPGESGVIWSDEIAPLLEGQGQVMKSYVKLQRPGQFQGNFQFRADLETRTALAERGWKVYDEDLPQTRAYSVAFRMPTDFNYSTVGNTVPGAIENGGYNWIVAQWLDFSSPVTPPFAIHMRGKDLLFRNKLYTEWDTIARNVDQHFADGEWIVFLAIARWSFGNDGKFVLYYDWIDPAEPRPSAWQEAFRLEGVPTMHPQVAKRATPMFKVGGYYWLLKQARFNQHWWDENVGVDREFVMYYDLWRGLTLADPAYRNFDEADIQAYFAWRVEE